MSDLKFNSFVLDEMPVGTSFRDSDHVVTKKDEGWECDDCSSPTTKDSSSLYMSDPSEKYALEKFAGAEIDLDDLDPRLTAFLPVGTRVADRDTGSDNLWHWYKTKTGRWIWTENYERAETLANNKEKGYEDLSDYDYVRPFRLFSLGTDEAPESEVAPTDPVKLTAAEATSLRDAVYDNGGGKWIYTSEGGYRLTLGGNLLGQLREQLPADYAPYFTEDPRGRVEPKKIPEGKTVFSAAEATNFKDCRFLDKSRDVWVFDEEIERWRFILPSGELSYLCQDEKLSHALEPFTLVEDEPEPETEEKTRFSEKEASRNKDTVFDDNDGDTWFFDHGMQRWRAIGSGWDYAKEKLDSFFGPYTRVGPLSEFERPWTAGEANELKDEALEDREGDIWVYDVPSEMWKCSNYDALERDDLEENYQPYRIKKAAQETAAPAGCGEPSSDPEASEEVTFEGSAKEAVDLLDRIAKALESIDRKLGDK